MKPVKPIVFAENSIIPASELAEFEDMFVEICTKCGLKRINGEEKTIGCGIGTPKEDHDYQKA